MSVCICTLEFCNKKKELQKQNFQGLLLHVHIASHTQSKIKKKICANSGEKFFCLKFIARIASGSGITISI